MSVLARASSLDEIKTAVDASRHAYAQKAIRVQFGETMLAMGAERPDFLVLTADLMFATGMHQFGERFPHRMYNLGIAEQNMAGVAAGLALCGKLPVVCGYAAFTTLRAVEQIKLGAAYNATKIVFAAQSAGLSYGVGGPTHQTYEDVAIMRAIPNTIVVVPSDAREVDGCMRAAIGHEAASPIYVRLGRGPEYLFNEAGSTFRIGEAIRLRDGADLCLIANGSMVFEALLAADYLASNGIRSTVLNVHTVKPIDANAVISSSRNVEAVVVVEEHSAFGGLGSAVLEVLAETHAPPVKIIGIPDRFPPIGPAGDLRASLGLCAENIVKQACDMLSRSASRTNPSLAPGVQLV